MPKSSAGFPLVALAARKADEFQLHAPGRKEVHPDLSPVGTGGPDCWFAKHPDTLGLKVGDGGIDVVDIERQVMPTNVTVFRLSRVLIRRCVLEDLEIGSRTTAQEAQSLHDGAWMNIEVGIHPIVACLKRTKFVERFAANHIDKEIDSLIEVGNGEADVIGAKQARKAVSSFERHFSSIHSFPATRLAGYVSESVQSPCHVTLARSDMGAADIHITSETVRRQCGN